jgi:hypothetical protein
LVVRSWAITAARDVLVHSAAKIAAHPEKPFPQVLDWNELRGFYRLCNERRVTWEVVM